MTCVVDEIGGAADTSDRRSVSSHNSFGHSRGSGRVDDAIGVVGRDLQPWGVVKESRRKVSHIQHLDFGVCDETSGPVPAGVHDDEGRTAVLKDVLKP